MLESAAQFAEPVDPGESEAGFDQTDSVMNGHCNTDAQAGTDMASVASGMMEKPMSVAVSSVVPYPDFVKRLMRIERLMNQEYVTKKRV